MSAPRDFDTGITAAELDPQRPRPLETPWGTVALYRIGERTFCVQAFCPHMLGPLFQGTVSGESVTCPWHQWRYDLNTGECVERPPGDDPAPGEELVPGANERLLRLAVRSSPAGTLILAPIDPS